MEKDFWPQNIPDKTYDMLRIQSKYDNLRRRFNSYQKGKLTRVAKHLAFITNYPRYKKYNDVILYCLYLAQNIHKARFGEFVWL